MDRVAPRFSRVEPRRHARELVLGLLAGLPRSNCWTIAEHAGDLSPDGLQHLLGRAVWDDGAVRDDLRGYVLHHLAEPDAVLVVDETGDLKKGTDSVGVQRQYTGTAGRIENAQVGVHLVYAARAAHTFIDRALYLPRSWAEDPERMRAAGVPAGTVFATKPALALQMIVRALDAGTPAGWVAGDEVYGADPHLRAELHRRGVGYVLGVASNRHVRTPAGRLSVAELAGLLPASAWQTRSAGPGSKGPRDYLWAWIDVQEPDAPGRHWVLIRRHPRSGDLAFFRAHAPRHIPLAALIRVAGRRWAVKECFQTGKELTGLDQHQVRRWTSWHRWTVLAMLAHAFLTITAAAERSRTGTPSHLIALTVNEIRRLFTHLVARPLSPVPQLLRWLHWRRRHQARARACHYQRHEDHDLRL